ncbi:MAG: NAD(P)-dependent oxidoreductase [Solirubrobacterales bacterium]
MKILVAGATGAIGRPLVAQLVAAGHEVIGLTRNESRAADLREQGATPIICDVLDTAASRRVVLDVKPEVVIDQLTSLARKYDVRKLAEIYAPNNQVRRVGTRGLIDAAKEAGVRRYIVQSIAFLYRPGGTGPNVETDGAWVDAPGPFAEAVRIPVENERLVTEATEFEGLALRYGFLYGPGTYLASDGSFAEQVRKRQFPIVGRGTGVTSYVHVSDAAAATVSAVEHGAPGIYNIVDDDPTPMREWLPIYAEILGAKPPRRMPAWIAGLAADRAVAQAATGARGASNAKAKGELGWEPAVPSWRDGFEKYLDGDPQGSVDA